MTKAAIATIALGTIGGIAYLASSDSSQSESFLKAQEFTPMGEFELEFMKFVAQHNRHFDTREEYSHRYNVFEQNMKSIRELEKKVSHQVGINQFADWTKEEFRSISSGFKPSPEISSTVNFPKNPVVYTLPASVDWREKGGVTPIINQGQCGSSWAFGATEALEGRWFAKHGELYTLSAQQLLDCETKHSFGCNGGQMFGAFEYAETHGIETVEDYPYQADKGGSWKCRYDASKGKVTDKGYKNLVKGSSFDFKKQLLDGPVSTAVAADKEAFMFYKGGIIQADCDGQYPDHGIAAVGYGVEKGVEYIILKNTWGENWGEKGFVRVQNIDGEGMCGVNKYAVYPIM